METPAEAVGMLRLNRKQFDDEMRILELYGGEIGPTYIMWGWEIKDFTKLAEQQDFEVDNFDIGDYTLIYIELREGKYNELVAYNIQQDE